MKFGADAINFCTVAVWWRILSFSCCRRCNISLNFGSNCGVVALSDLGKIPPNQHQFGVLVVANLGHFALPQSVALICCRKMLPRCVALACCRKMLPASIENCLVEGNILRQQTRATFCGNISGQQTAATDQGNILRQQKTGKFCCPN